MRRLFVDTSAWFAYANRKDPDHAPVRETLDGFDGRLVTSNYVFDETVSLCRYRLGHRVAGAVGSVLLDPDIVDLTRLTADDERTAWDLFRERPDQRYSFTDCTSFALMRRLDLSDVLTLDEDFRIEGFRLLLNPAGSRTRP
jgi:hypothetical protein